MIDQHAVVAFPVFPERREQLLDFHPTAFGQFDADRLRCVTQYIAE